MKITDVKLTLIRPPMAKRYDGLKPFVGGLNFRVVARVETDNGIVGFGEERVKPSWRPPSDAEIEQLVDRNPFDFVNSTLPQSVGAALYDVMGKHLEVPAHELMGQKVRDAVSVAAWCPEISAEAFASEVARAAGQGYNIIKMHTSERYDPIEQTKAAEDVAPEHFRIHYDFNGGRGRTLGAVKPLVAEIEQNHPIVGWIEDALPKHDVDGWRRLRQQTQIPLVMHRTVLGGLQEAMLGMADIFMIAGGHTEPSIADTLSRGFAYGKANVQVIMQVTGGALAKALAMHMSAVLPTATGHSIDLDDQYEEDIVREPIPVVEGSSPVPTGPGLGVEVDEDAIARFASDEPYAPSRFVGVLYLPGGHKAYSLGAPSVTRLMGREEGAVRGVDFEVWEDDGSEEYRRVYERVEAERTFLE